MDEKPKNDQELHSWAIQLQEDGEDARRVWEGIWWENLATYAGDFWVEWDVHRRRLWEPVKKPDHKARLPINLAQPVVRTEYAKLVKNRPITDVLANSNDKSDLNSAEVGDKILNHFVEREFHMPRVRRRALQWVLMMGLGGIFVDWDESADAPIEVYMDPHGQPVFDERVIEAYKAYYKKQKKAPRKETIPRGDLRIVPVGPLGIVWDFSQIYIEDAWWCIITEVYDCEVAAKRWGKRPERDSDAQAGILERRLIGRFDLTDKIVWQPSDTQELCKVHRLFVKPRHPYFPDGAHIVFDKDNILYKENFPYGHEELPISLMGHVPLPVSQFPMSVLQAVRAPVLELSKTESQLLDNRNLVANPPWLIAKQHNIADEIQNRPGARIEFTYVPNVPEPHPIQMPDMPQYVKDLPVLLREHILEISGQGETSQGRVPPGARSGVAIAYLQEEDDTRLGPTVSEFEEMMERVNFQILRLIAENYDVTRTVRIYRKHGEPEVFDFVGTMLSGCAGVVVQAGSALPRSKAAKQQYILDLWDRKLEQNPQRVREMLELSEGDPEDYQLDMDQAERENRRMLAGEEVAVEEWHNHPAHHYVHRKLMKSADYDALSLQQQEIIRGHDAEHTQYEQQAQQRQLEQQAMAARFGPTSGNGGAPVPLEPGSNGQNVPEGPPAQFSGEITQRSLLDQSPQ